MKKFLLGLLALSSMSLAANVDLEVTPTENTNVFQTGQLGKIQVEATLMTDVPVVKYVVFASATGDLSDAQDTLVLPSLVLTRDESKNTFVGTPDKIYVKRVMNGALGELTDTDNVSFLATGFDESYTSHTADVITLGKTTMVYPMTAFISKTRLAEIATTAYGGVDGAAPDINAWGEIEAIFNGERRILRFPNKINARHETRGVLELGTTSDSAYSEAQTMTQEQSEPAMEQFVGSVTGTVYFQVKID